MCTTCINSLYMKEKFFLICMDKLTKIKKSKEKSSRNTTTSNGGTPCASKNEYNDAKIKKYSTASASEQLICEETQREFNLLDPQRTIYTRKKTNNS